tara:strand:+ start:69 stop:374 length:306 start_codon:yes stop_codon:yes gene_type:complete
MSTANTLNEILNPNNPAASGAWEWMLAGVKVVLRADEGTQETYAYRASDVAAWCVEAEAAGYDHASSCSPYQMFCDDVAVMACTDGEDAADLALIAVLNDQ